MRWDEMEEKKVFFGQGNIRLEGLYANASGAMGAVISHPHPLLGGDMKNLFVPGNSTKR